MEKTKKKLISKKTLIAEIVERYPELAEVLVENYGFHCIGCYASTMESLEEGAMVHGMTAKEITEMIGDLNDRATISKKTKK